MAYPYTRDLQIDSSEQSGDPVEILPFEGRSHLCAPTGVMVELERLHKKMIGADRPQVDVVRSHKSLKAVSGSVNFREEPPSRPSVTLIDHREFISSGTQELRSSVAGCDDNAVGGDVSAAAQ